MSRFRLPEWVGSALLLSLAMGVAYVMWGLATENRQLKSELAELRAQSSILGTAMQPGDRLPTVPLTDLAGRPATLADLVPRGGVVAFLTTTCPFCKETLPAWGELARAYTARDVPFVGVSLDEVEPTRSYAHEMGVAWPLWVPEEPLAASAELKVPLVPLTVLVGDDGVVQRIWSGALSELAVTELLDALGPLVLTSSVPSPPVFRPGHPATTLVAARPPRLAQPQEADAVISRVIILPPASCAEGGVTQHL